MKIIEDGTGIYISPLLALIDSFDAGETHMDRQIQTYFKTHVLQPVMTLSFQARELNDIHRESSFISFGMSGSST